MIKDLKCFYCNKTINEDLELVWHDDKNNAWHYKCGLKDDTKT